MKRTKLLKTLFISAPIVIVPLIANSCNNINKLPKRYYYSFKNYTTGIGSNTVSGVYSSANGSSVFVATTKDYEDDGGLSIGTKSGDNYTFKNYNESNGLSSDNVRDVYASSNGNTIYITSSDGVSIGTKDDNTYTFTNYTPKDGLLGDVTKITASANGNTIFIGTDGQGIAVGTRPSISARYTFSNITTAYGLGANVVNQIITSKDGNTIYAATSNGVSIGTKQSVGVYQFTNYAAGLTDSNIKGVAMINKGSTIYAATRTGGFSVGNKNGNSYLFNNYGTRDGLGSTNTYDVHALANGNNVYVATYNGISVGTKISSKYTYKNNNCIVVNQRKEN